MMSDGRAVMKALSGLAATSITATAMIDRRHHHVELVDHADRGDDRVQREHDVERDDLRHDRPEGGCAPGAAASPVGCTSRRSWISIVAFTSRKSPPAMRMRSRQDTPWPHTANTGFVSDMTQLMPASNARRMTSASVRPIRRARSRSPRRQPAGENRDEDQVVDAEDDLEHDERREADPDRRIGHPFHGVSTMWRRFAGARLK